MLANSFLHLLRTVKLQKRTSASCVAFALRRKPFLWHLAPNGMTRVSKAFSRRLFWLPRVAPNAGAIWLRQRRSKCMCETSGCQITRIPRLSQFFQRPFQRARVSSFPMAVSLSNVCSLWDFVSKGSPLSKRSGRLWIPSQEVKRKSLNRHRLSETGRALARHPT